jgi:hypothetical protein
MGLWTAREGSSVISSQGRRSNHDFLLDDGLRKASAGERGGKSIDDASSS